MPMPRFSDRPYPPWQLLEVAPSQESADADTAVDTAANSDDAADKTKPLPAKRGGQKRMALLHGAVHKAKKNKVHSGASSSATTATSTAASSSGPSPKPKPRPKPKPKRKPQRNPKPKADTTLKKPATHAKDSKQDATNLDRLQGSKQNPKTSDGECKTPNDS
eukprot:8844060-Alexandrium_andersonii.AAC.1